MQNNLIIKKKLMAVTDGNIWKHIEVGGLMHKKVTSGIPFSLPEFINPKQKKNMLVQIIR